MPKTHNIDAAEMFEPVMIKLWDGTEFRLREAVRSVESKVKKKQEEINALADRAELEEKELATLRRKLWALRDEDPASDEIEDIEREIEAKQVEIKEKAATLEDSLPYLIELLDILLEPKTPKLDPETQQQMTVPKETTQSGKPKSGTEMIPAYITAEEAINESLEKDIIGVSHIDALSRKLNETAMEARPT